MADLLPGVPDPLTDPRPYHRRPRWWVLPEPADLHRRALAAVARLTLPPPAVGGGRGLVTAGGGAYWPMVVAQIKMLRWSGNELPVEVWYRSSCEPVDPAQLAGLGDVVLRDADAEAADRRDRRFSVGKAGGWATKLYALVNTRFETVFFLDADAYPVGRLDQALDAAEAAGGFAHWLDVPAGRDNIKWNVVWPGDKARTNSFQGGQFAVHRPSAWRQLVVAKWVCDHADFYYANKYHIFGDQDAVRLAHAVTSKRTAVVGQSEWRSPGFVFSAGGTPLVVHRVGAKMLRPQDGGRYAPNFNLPAEDRAWAAFAEAVADARGRDAAAVFTAAYTKNLWDGGSGAGSRNQWVQATAALVNTVMAAAGWRSVADAGSGDGVVQSNIWAETYTGVDVCKFQIDRCRSKWPERAWVHADFYKDLDALPSADLLLVRDVLNHWPSEWVVDWVARVRRAGRWKAALFIQDAEQRYDGEDTFLGGHRGLDPNFYPLNVLGLNEVSRMWSKAVLMIKPQSA